MRQLWLLAIVILAGIAGTVGIGITVRGRSEPSGGLEVSKKRILILCTGNSCRSQMAEAIWRHEAGDRYEIASAGTVPKGVNPLTIKALEEAGISTAGLRSKSVEEFSGAQFDLVVTVCDSARDHCPVWPKTTRQEHWPFDDPPAAKGSEAEVMQVFQRVRDEIRQRIKQVVSDEVKTANRRS